jgi:hypothetical protein
VTVDCKGDCEASIVSAKQLRHIRVPGDFNADNNVRGEKAMANVYIEARPKGRLEAIQDYVVEDHADHVLGTFKTQKEAIDWAKAKGHVPLVARVRHLNDKKNPDHWRSA